MKEIGNAQVVNDWFIGWRDCEKGKPQQSESEGYVSGYSACQVKTQEDRKWFQEVAMG